MKLKKTLGRLAKIVFAVVAIVGFALALPKPSYAACVVQCTQDAVCAQRPDTCPGYKIGNSDVAGDVAVLLITTNPPRPGQTVTRSRHFIPENQSSEEATVSTVIGTTGKNGAFTNVVPLPPDPSLLGIYVDTYFVGEKQGNTLTYSIFSP